jgi:Ca-activated chloride channel homolog
MVVTAQHVRTSLVLAAAGAAVIAAWLLAPRTAGVLAPHLAQATDAHLAARLTSSHLLAGERDQHVAVTIRAPRGAAAVRPPLSLAVVIDRSGSMTGQPIADAKAAAIRLVEQLTERDAFSIVTYSSTDETVVAMTRATAEAKAGARDAIAGIWDDGNTCISCGLARGAAELARTPIAGGLRRIVLISDGQANTGVRDPNGLAQLATDTAARGISISTVGVGLDFDEVTMTRLADVGRGRYYFVEDTAELARQFATELAGLAETVASDTRLVIDPGQGVHVTEVYGYPFAREGHRVIVPIADLRAGELRKVVIRTAVTRTTPGHIEIASFALHYRRIADGAVLSGHAALAATLTTDAGAVAAGSDRAAINAVEQARTASVLEEATRTYEHQGQAAAERVLRRHLSDVRANKYVDAPALEAIEAASGDAIVNFAKEPPQKAKKAARADAYKLAR